MDETIRNESNEEDLLTVTHEGDEYGKYLGAVVPPVFMNSLHVFPTLEDYYKFDPFEEDSYVYGREGNPTARLAERKIAKLEHGVRAALFASGMAATVSAIMATCEAGCHIVCLRDVYGGVKAFLNSYGIPQLHMTVTYVSGQDLDELERAIRPNTRLICLESPATFVFTVVDLAAVAQIAKRHGVRTLIDNTYCTPIFQKPLDFGIDISMHTLSKYLGGHSDVIGGVLVSKDEELMRRIVSPIRSLFGGIMGPMEAWLVVRGIRTLDVRVRRHQETATAAAEFLEAHPKVKHVFYPGLKSNPQRELIDRQQTGSTGLLSFVLNAPDEEVPKFVDCLRLFKIGCSWGGFESLVMAPLFHSSDEDLRFLGLPDGRRLIRIHCGLEGADALIADLSQALDGVKTF